MELPEGLEGICQRRCPCLHTAQEWEEEDHSLGRSEVPLRNVKGLAFLFTSCHLVIHGS